MPTGSGARLGPYVLGPALGAGGMGEVYRAHDSRLGRDVAIKILPPDVADDPERLRRFASEARAAAALNHPNILVVHDVGRLRAEGATAGQGREDEIAYLVTELLEGRTLRAAIDGGAVPLPRALDYAVQIAEGLAAAHARGIVHRDLKPENVFVTTDGRVKILDFGLAKTVHIPDVAATTLTGVGMVTGAHVVLGTPGYMAPEQVRGEPVDQRADIFAFGCVLYELLGGGRAFAGATTLEVLSAILRDTPAPLPSLTPALARIVARCLEKDPAARFQSARDLAFALRGLAAGSRVTLAQFAGAPGRKAFFTRRAGSGNLKRHVWLGIAAPVAVLLVVGVVAAAGWRLGGRPAAGAEPPRAVVIRVAADFPPAPHPAGIALQAFAARVAEAIPGSEARLYFAGELHSVPEAFQALKDGTLELGWGQFGKTADVEPWVHAILVPGVLNTVGSIDGLDQMATVQAIFDRFDTVHGIKILGTGHMSFAMGIAATRRIVAPEDLRGKHVRSMGALDGAQLQAWGALPRTMAFGEIAAGARAADLEGATTSIGGWLNLRDRFPFFTITGVNGIGSDYYWLGVSRRWWNALNESTRRVLVTLVVDEIIPLQKRVNFCIDQFSIQRFTVHNPAEPGIYTMSPAADLDRLGRAGALDWLTQSTPAGAHEWLRRFIQDAGPAVAASPPGSSWIEQTNCEALVQQGLIPRFE